ncbi:MAG TPA: TetR/AcrR family transcriptional regulator [Acidimicrobiales bacterium]|nr:TetR/AcrR family transcriptional regulator [Acidimicrobiales bacterium]
MPGKPRSDTRERLLDAAFGMFLEKGYEGTAITDGHAYTQPAPTAPDGVSHQGYHDAGGGCANVGD